MMPERSHGTGTGTTHVPAWQVWPAAQQPQPHFTPPESQTTAMHLPSEQVWPHAQAGEQLLSEQMPPTHAPPLLQPHVPPHPSDAPQLPSMGQAGLQHLPAAT